jgi:oligosaccharide reducing-end xylanase
MKPRRALGCALLCTVLASALGGCHSTLDSLGTDLDSNSAGSAGDGGNTDQPNTLRAVQGPSSYYNAFSNLLSKSDTDITRKIEAAFAQLFYGTSEQIIFYQHQTADDRSLILDILHQDVRTEGIGLAMVIAVELNKRDEFDQLWRYSKGKLQQDSGAARGYFSSYCGEDSAAQCYDVYGMQHFVLALMLANSRWHSTPEMPYASDALALLDLLQNKEAENGGVVMGIGSAFDARSHLVREEPTLADAGFTTRSALQMPAAYWYWQAATGSAFWGAAASAARTHLLAAADPKTGLWPMRSYFDGTAVDGSPGFTAQGYRTQLNLALDALWGSASADQAELASRVLDFFYGKGLDTYGITFSVDGTTLDDSSRAQALISVNGALAVAAPSNAHRAAFVQAVWDQAIPIGENRYYDGLLYLMSMLVLSGRMQVL